MKKRMITLAVALMLMLSFASCGADVDTATDIAKAEITTAAPIETTAAAQAAVEVVTKADQPTTTAAATTAADKAQPTTKKVAATTTKKNNSAKNNAPAKTTKKAVSTTKKAQPAATTKAQSSGLTKADYDWVLSEAISYIKSLPQAKIDSSASAYSAERIYLFHHKTKESALKDLKDCINLEYGYFKAAGGIGMNLNLSNDGEDYFFKLRYTSYLN